MSMAESTIDLQFVSCQAEPVEFLCELQEHSLVRRSHAESAKKTNKDSDIIVYTTSGKYCLIRSGAYLSPSRAALGLSRPLLLAPAAPPATMVLSISSPPLLLLR